jgi:hypothetical protein
MLGFRARRDLRAGLQATWDWFRAHRDEYDALDGDRRNRGDRGKRGEVA